MDLRTVFRRMRLGLGLVSGAVFVAASGLAAELAYDPPQADTARTTQALKALPRKPSDRVAVSVYEFRCALPGLSAAAATDMFKTALVQSGQFRVVERSRLNEGVVREKQLQQGGFASGSAAPAQLRGAQYLFEGAVSEANATEHQRSATIGIGGMQIGGGSNRDAIAIDVRVVEVATGDIIDAITVRKSVRSQSSGVAGVGTMVGALLAHQGRSLAVVPDLNVQEQQREGLDSAVREALNQAVIELAQRFAQ
ncbi:MAG: hypothetical protein IT522_14025 [Burkholderiales bacterium]|nr:hypothetical protein [Burkholderiales bacterium]